VVLDAAERKSIFPRPKKFPADHLLNSWRGVTINQLGPFARAGVQSSYSSCSLFPKVRRETNDGLPPWRTSIAMLSAQLWQSQKFSIVARFAVVLLRGTEKSLPCR